MGRGAPSEDRLSEHHHVGHSPSRVTVPRPADLQTLQSYVKRHFGGMQVGAVPQKMWHHGKYRVGTSDHVKDIKHDEVVVVHSAPPEFRPRPRVTGNMSKEALATTHKADFPQYAQAHYAKKKAADRVYATKGGAATLRFDGTTTHKSTYVHHEVASRSPRQAKETASRRMVASPQIAFEASTTYATDFHEKKSARQIRSQTAPARQVAREAAAKQVRIPFQGASEYATLYRKHELPRREYIHLEPREYKRAHSDAGLSPKSMTSPSEMSVATEEASTYKGSE